jgi:hypothetical protein
LEKINLTGLKICEVLFIINAKKNYLFSVITGLGKSPESLLPPLARFFKNGLKKSKGIGKIVVELFSVAISRKVCR